MPKRSPQPISRIPGGRLALRMASRLAAWVRSAPGSSFCGGSLAGLFAVAFCHQVFARLGGGLITSAGAAAAVVLGLLAGAVGGSPLGVRSRGPSLVAALIPAAWFLAIGWLADGLDQACCNINLELLASPWGQFAAAFAAALLLLGIPTACAARLVLRRAAADGFWTLAAVAAGCLVAAYGFGPWFGVQWAGLVAAGLTVAWSLRIAIRRWQTVTAPEASRDESAPIFSPNAAEQTELTVTTGSSAIQFAQIVIGSVAASLVAAALARLVQQLMPGTEAMEWTTCAGFLLGAAAAWRIVRSESAGQRRSRRAFVILIAALGCALPVVLFPILTDLFLATTATLSSVWLLLLVRGLAATAVLFTTGALWAAIVGWRPAERSADAGNARHPALLVSAVPALFAGLIAGRWLIVLGAPLPLLVAAGALLPATFAAAAAIRTSTGRGRLAWSATWTATAAIFAVGIFARTYEPSRSARLLFATNVFAAWRDATESRLLPFLDDNRLLTQREGECGTYTVWKMRGLQFGLRQSGIPCGTFCPWPEVGPQFSGEIVPCVLPLVLHESPRHMLILGLGSGSGVAACLEFPIEDVTCVEADRSLIDVLETTFWPAANPNPRGDNRVHMLCAEPSLAVHARGGLYDVVYADSGQSGVSQGTAHFTREFYAGAARQLSTNGIFAQRFQQVDFGPWPLQSVLATLKSVFSHVAAIEVAPGELALLATQSDQGLDRPNLLERFQTPQARRILAHLGWDWSIVLNLATYSGDQCAALTRGSAINTAANGLFAFRLPQETMRWGPKNEELAATLGPHAGRMAQWPNVDGNDSALLRRLSDVMREHDLMISYPDQPWAYRKLVREELTKHPHTTVEDGEEGFERRLEATDRRRVEYFKALGQATRSARPTLDCLRRIEEFAEPYDPVLTYFLHHELAILYGRSEAAGSMPQLQHRLYSVYYSDPRDRSVRDVVDALEILIRESPLVSADQRWDYLNALLGFLETRWANRGLAKPKSTEIVLNDLERSIDAVESSLSLMDRLRATVGIAESDWSARRSVLERGLVRPLRSYRSELIPEYQKESDKTASSEAIEPPPSAN
jgi:hypothetical protein